MNSDQSKMIDDTAIDFSVSNSAWTKIKNVLASTKPNDGLRFRVEVVGGGCSGFQYKFDVDSSFDPEDDIIIANTNGAEAVIDSTSLAILRNSILDHISNLGGEYFEIKNPNAKARCGCGNSFAV